MICVISEHDFLFLQEWRTDDGEPQFKFDCEGT